MSIGFLASCSSPATQPSYEENKKMFIDALQTEDGEKSDSNIIIRSSI